MAKLTDIYTLGASKEEQHRLEEQQLLYADSAYLNIDEGKIVCEVGCGSGANLWVAAKLKTGQYIGVDFQATQIETCRQKAKQLGLDNVDFYCADAHKLPLANESVDVTFCRLLLIHLADPENVLKEMLRITCSGGRLIVIEPEVNAYFTTKPMLMKCFRARTQFIYRPQHGTIDVATQLKNLFVRLGLVDIEIIRHDIFADATNKEKLGKLLKNWSLMNKPIADILIKEKRITQQELDQAEQEVNDLTAKDIVYQRLWIARAKKP